MPMEDVTNIHFHGFHVSPLPPLGDQVVTTLVKPGEAHHYMFKNGEEPYPEATLATVNVAGKRLQSPPLPKHARLGREKLPQPTAHKTKVLTQTPDGTKFMINGKTFDPTRIDNRVPLGAVEDWTLVNRTNEQHPIHVHQNAFWVVERNGKPVNPNGKQDTVIVPPGQRVTIRIPFEQFTGELVFHCHILYHEDHGMMSTIEVFKPKNPQK
jgi:suppressor of ftsI